MAKKKASKEKQDAPAEPDKSVLGAAWEAFQRGDVVTARRLASAAAAGKLGKDDERVAVELSKLLSAEDAPVGAGPGDVAKELVARTKGPGKPYLFAALAAGVFVLLVVLAAARY